MRGFIIFLIVAGLSFLYWRQRQSETSPEPAKQMATQQVSTKAPPPELTPAPRGQASQYNYMKRALDRAADVRDQARSRSKEAQDIHP